MEHYVIIEGRRVIAVIVATDQPQIKTSARVERLEDCPHLPSGCLMEWDETNRTIVMAAADPNAMRYGNGFAPMHLTKDKWLTAHTHDVHHHGYVLEGTVRLRIGQNEIELSAPAVVDLPPHIEHEARPLTDEALWASVFPEQVKGR
jgi:mannose-6-phosphate isomerase-like protein (cupin superfamily)